MGRASRKKKEPNEILGVFYKAQGSLLYGCIAFYKPDGSQERVRPCRQSAPFVISDTIGTETFIYGSVSTLMREIQQLVQEVYDHAATLAAELGSAATEESPVHRGNTAVVSRVVPEDDRSKRAYFSYTRRMINTLILLSAQTRNLFDIFPRLGSRMPLLDYTAQPTGNVPLRGLFNQFVHNRYLFFDGEYVSDLFSDESKATAPISRSFMGYKINWADYVEAIRDAIHGIRVKDLTGLLRARLETLSLKTASNDIVFLVQNLESFSRLLTMKVPDKRYSALLDRLFGGMTDSLLRKIRPNFRDGNEVRLEVVFTSPHIKIHPELAKKQFEVSVNARLTAWDSDGQLIHKEGDLTKRAVHVGYAQLFDDVTRAFGEEPLLGFSLRESPGPDS